MTDAARQTIDFSRQVDLLEQVVTPLCVRLQRIIKTDEIRFYVWDEELARCLPVHEKTATQTWNSRFEQAINSLVNQVLAAGESNVVDPVGDHPILGPVGPSYLQNIILIPYVLVGSEPLGVLVLINADRRRLGSERDTLDLLVAPTLMALRGRWQVQQVTLQNRELQQDKLHLLAILKELKAAKEEEEKTNRIKSQFMGTMSHELLTPVSVIKSNVAVLMERLFGDINPEQENRLATIERNAGDLLRLIQGLLDISQLEEGRMPIYPETFHIGELLNELHAEFVDLSRKKGITLQVQGGRFDTPMLSDRMKVKQILNNLLTNAMKFTRKGEVQVEVHQVTEGDQIKFVVRDTGIGIKSENLTQIFDLFYQVDSSDQRELSGTGMGLNIVKKLVTRLQGEIHVESEFGKGTTFHVILPREISLSDQG
jgi:signal transduction histidine kinase